MIKIQPRKKGQDSEKQTIWANKICAEINDALQEISDKGFGDYANEAAEFYNKMGSACYGGASDIIDYLKDEKRYNVFARCYGFARRDRNPDGVKTLNPRAL